MATGNQCVDSARGSKDADISCVGPGQDRHSRLVEDLNHRLQAILKLAEGAELPTAALIAAPVSYPTNTVKVWSQAPAPDSKPKPPAPLLT